MIKLGSKLLLDTGADYTPLFASAIQSSGYDGFSDLAGGSELPAAFRLDRCAWQRTDGGLSCRAKAGWNGPRTTRSCSA